MAIISDLPEEMLIEVFEKLDPESVKNAALVCKCWNKMITTTLSIMKKFILRVNPNVFLLQYDKKNFDVLMKLKSHLTSADISQYNEYTYERNFKELHRNLGFLPEFEAYVHSILEDAVLTSEMIVTLLKNNPELEELTLNFWHHKRFTNEELDLNTRQPAESPNMSTASVTLKKLKKLVIKKGFDALDFIKAPSLVDIAYRGADTSGDLKSLERFLKASTKLESLAINLEAFENMTPGFPFKLKKISSEVPGFFTLSENIKEFLLSQAATVETLDVHCNDSEFYEIVLTKFKRLRILHTDLDMLTAKREFYENLKPLPFLEEIKSPQLFSSDVAMRAVLGNCPALVKLECSFDDKLPENLDFIADHNRKLKHLAISTIKATNARFERLESLTLTEQENADDLIAFLRNNPTVRNVKCKDFTRDEMILVHVTTDDGGWENEIRANLQP